MHPTPLPEPLRDHTFTVREAAAAGVPPKRLRARDLDRSVWGVRGPQSHLQQLGPRCRAFALRLDGGVAFSHATAALLWGAPLPWHLEKRASLDVSVCAPAPAPHATGIRGHSLMLLASDIIVRDGVRCTSAARTWCDLASILSLGDLVALGDFLIQRELPVTTRPELREMVNRWVGRRGAKRARQALELLSERSESRPESRLRVLLVTAGLPQPRVNHVIVNTESGKALRLDLAFDEVKLVLEYQGDYHRTREQWRKDMTRRARLEADGWYVMEINADDLRDEAELVARIRRVLFRRANRTL